MDFLDELNKPQREAAEHINGPMMVIAGAGSGKTRVLTYRIAQLMNKGVDPFSILALTFTNKAAKEMKERVGRVVGHEEARNLMMGTFHSVFARILRVESDRINYPHNFTIYDSQDSRALIKDIIKGLKLDDKEYKTASVAKRISGAKNNLLNSEDYLNHAEIQAEDRQSGKPFISKIFKVYENRCMRAGAMDFDDLLYKMNVLLRDFPDLLNKYQHRFKYILVDEYQDTNYAQYLIIKQLAAAHENICVVGDDAQSIYGFRGASIQNILNFKKDYPDTKTYKLEQNYRSTKVIVNAANSVIAANKDQIKKDVWTSNSEGEKIKIHKAASDNYEGRFVADSIYEMRGRAGSDYGDFAILYRTNAQSRSFEESLRKINIPYRIYGGLSFYQRKEIKDLIAYFRLTANPRDDEALRRIINYPARGIGNTTLDRLFAEAEKRDMGVYDLMTLGEQPQTIKKAAWTKIQSFTEMMTGFAAELSGLTAHALGLQIAKRTGLVHQLYTDKSPEGVARYDNIQELLNGLQSFSEQEDFENPGAIRTLSEFLLDVALLTDADNDDDDTNKVSLMTIHASKGLEFKHVHIVGLEENLFPSQRSMESRADMEEERRLFYVALTRAEQSCVLSYATSRFKWGQMHHGDPSRFLNEIDEQYIIRPSGSIGNYKTRGWSSKGDGNLSNDGNIYRTMTSHSPSLSGEKKDKNAYKPTIGGRNLTKVSDSSEPTIKFDSNSVSNNSTSESRKLSEGNTVQHAKFGKGKVVKIEGDEPNVKATIFFPSVGTKQLLLKFAKLSVL
ncbi:MAG: UvrD-helicase domain-containing protein [Flavobacteriales bacterium]|nr:UvrD-helicase domain-containing protein [Flavobacteriales bacterium]MBT7652882.1 UvrD-helicase domain-containing protein [Flavobacteriales bacterium]